MYAPWTYPAYQRAVGYSYNAVKVMLYAGSSGLSNRCARRPTTRKDRSPLVPVLNVAISQPVAGLRDRLSARDGASDQKSSLIMVSTHVST